MIHIDAMVRNHLRAQYGVYLTPTSFLDIVRHPVKFRY